MFFIWTRFLALFGVFICILPIQNLFSEEKQVIPAPFASSTPEEPKEEIFDFIPEAGRGLFTVNSQSLYQLRSMIVPELLNLVKAGELEFDVVRSLSYELKYDESWRRRSDQAKGEVLTSEKYPRPQMVAERGFVFGPPSELMGATKSEEKAHKVLWNVYSLFWSETLVKGDLGISVVKENKVEGKFKFAFSKLYVAALPSFSKGKQFFREKLELIQPEVISGFKWLTFRFFGGEEDALWIYSPPIKKTRQLVGSNRGDPLLRTQISLDDLFLWSGKPELVAPVLENEEDVLLPFPSSAIASLEGLPDSKCTKIHDEFGINESGEASHWDLEPGSYVPTAFPIPSGTIFIPRKMWRIELVSKDPYSLYGRQVLYVDSELMLPVYKVVYNHNGQLWKIILASFGLASNKDNSKVLPYPAYMVVSDRLQNETSLVDYKGLTYCGLGDGELDTMQFDPGKLGEE